VLAVPVLLWALVGVALGGALLAPLRSWLEGEDSYDQAALEEWLDEARGIHQTLPEMVADYLDRVRRLADLRRREDRPEVEEVRAEQEVALKRDEILEHLKSLGNPPTKMYPGQLPLFPLIYRLEVSFEPGPEGELVPIVWDSGLPCDATQYRTLVRRLHPQVSIAVRYQLHAYSKRQRIEQEHARRLRQLSVVAAAAAVLALAATVLVLSWLLLLRRREGERERQRRLAQHQADQAERLLLVEARRHEETERKLLEQRLATQAAERRALELKSQLYASIGIMAGSYAHNIKNLLVRPNDLLRRCLEGDGLPAEQALMLREVQETLGTVTERLQQILHTVRRDLSHAEPTAVDLNAVLHELERTWGDLARDKWKMDVVLELNVIGGLGGRKDRERERPADASPAVPDAPPPEPLWVAGDESHLQQAVENLLFNARDATFEMRNHLRDAARQAEHLDAAARRQALIAAAGWRGCVRLRTGRRDGEVVLEVQDNGAGMAEEVRRRCTETHFSTKRDNALYEGHSTGMGLGLSFVVAILEHHRATLEIDSEPLHGTTFRIRFPAQEVATNGHEQGQGESKREG
jgi:signal transduction histidine kinase